MILLHDLERTDPCALLQFWEVRLDEDGHPAADFMSSLSGHMKTVNCVRFSPTGDVLASGMATATQSCVLLLVLVS